MVRVDAVAVDGRPLKRARWREEADGLLALGAGYDDAKGGPFRCCVRDFIARQARILPMPRVTQLRQWRIAFKMGTAFDLEVVEEDVDRSRRIYCDHCRIVGWSSNPVCRTRYHFIIRNENCTSSPQRQRLCSHCGSLRRLSEFRCNHCNHEVPSADLEEWAHLQLEDPTHLLHGLVHDKEKVDINGGTGSEPRIVQRSASFTPVEQERLNFEMSHRN